MIVSLAFVCALPCVASAAPENADDGCLQDSVCRGHYERAVALFEQGRFEPALAEFQAAYAQRQMPWLLINLGRTLHRLGRPKEALEHYELYTKAESRIDAETRQRLDKYIAQAQAATQLPPTPPGNGSLTENPPTRSSSQPGATPVYKKWWFWTAIGGGAAVLITGIAIGAATSGGSGPALPADVMTYKPMF